MSENNPLDPETVEQFLKVMEMYEARKAARATESAEAPVVKLVLTSPPAAPPKRSKPGRKAQVRGKPGQIWKRERVGRTKNEAIYLLKDLDRRTGYWDAKPLWVAKGGHGWTKIHDKRLVASCGYAPVFGNTTKP